MLVVSSPLARRATSCAATLLVSLTCVSALGCGPQGGLLGDGLDARKDQLSTQASDHGSREGTIEGLGRYPSSMAPLAWVERQELLASYATSGNGLGAGVSLSGATVVVGAPGHVDYSGAAYVFVRAATSWEQQNMLVAGDGARGDALGSGVSLSGGTVLLGAIGDDDLGATSGSAYIFVRSATSWAQQAKLLADDGAAVDRFGGSVSLSGNTALLGARDDDDLGASSGSAYIFVRSATSWTQQAKLVASGGGAQDEFGASVSVDGDTALVGATYLDPSGSRAGAVYIFVRSATSWAQQVRLIASDDAAAYSFGRGISLSGNTALVGASTDDPLGASSGSAYAFVRSATNWMQQAKIVASDGAEGDYFGGSVSLSGDTALVGARADADQGAGTGSAYMFVRSATSWTHQGKLVASDGAASEFFGSAVSVGTDMAIVGARLHVHAIPSLPESGAAYIFALRLSDGQACSHDDACVSNSCVDGYCCDGPCDGACEACNELGLDGVCTPTARGSVPVVSCNGHFCNGLLGGCPNGCAGDEDCTSTHHCPYATACVPKEVDGGLCANDSNCLSGHCVDGVCCAQACDSGCGSCVADGAEGVCTPVVEGYPGMPICSPYLCAGDDTGCPTGCARQDDCARGFHCAEGTCQTDREGGAACSEGVVCATGHCTDGVCCLVDACGGYRCGPGGTCGAACGSSAQCARGHECTSDGKCEPRGGSTGSPSSEVGSCHVANLSGPARRSLPWPSGLAMLAFLGLVRRCSRTKWERRAAGPIV